MDSRCSARRSRGYVAHPLLCCDTLLNSLPPFPEVTPANLQTYIGEVLKRLHVEMLVHGNMLKDEAISLSKLVENTFTPEPLTPEELRSHRALVVPEGELSLRA